MTSDRTTAIGLARYAREYFDCAMAADEKVGMRSGYEFHAPPPVMFLVAHAIELALKAYIRHQGKEVDELIRIGHDLTKCLDVANQHGLEAIAQLDDTDKHVLEVINRLHISTELRYIQTGYKEFPVFGPLHTLAQKLLDAICPYVGYR